MAEVRVIVDGQDLELGQAFEGIRLRKGLSDFREVQRRKGSFTYNFDVPLTDNNRRILSDLVAPQQRSRFDRVLTAQVLSDGNKVIEGVVTISGLNPYGDQVTLNVVAEFANVKAVLDNRTIRDVDFSQHLKIAGIDTNGETDYRNDETPYFLSFLGQAEDRADALYDPEDTTSAIWLTHLIRGIYPRKINHQDSYLIDSVPLIDSERRRSLNYFPEDVVDYAIPRTTYDVDTDGDIYDSEFVNFTDRENFFGGQIAYDPSNEDQYVLKTPKQCVWDGEVLRQWDPITSSLQVVDPSFTLINQVFCIDALRNVTDVNDLPENQPILIPYRHHIMLRSNGTEFEPLGSSHETLGPDFVDVGVHLGTLMKRMFRDVGWNITGEVLRRDYFLTSKSPVLPWKSMSRAKSVYTLPTNSLMTWSYVHGQDNNFGNDVDRTRFFVNAADPDLADWPTEPTVGTFNLTPNVVFTGDVDGIDGRDWVGLLQDTIQNSTYFDPPDNGDYFFTTFPYTSGNGGYDNSSRISRQQGHDLIKVTNPDVAQPNVVGNEYVAPVSARYSFNIILKLPISTALKTVGGTANPTTRIDISNHLGLNSHGLVVAKNVDQVDDLSELSTAISNALIGQTGLLLNPIDVDYDKVLYFTNFSFFNNATVTAANQADNSLALDSKSPDVELIQNIYSSLLFSSVTSPSDPSTTIESWFFDIDLRFEVDLEAGDRVTAGIYSPHFYGQKVSDVYPAISGPESITLNPGTYTLSPLANNAQGRSLSFELSGEIAESDQRWKTFFDPSDQLEDVDQFDFFTQYIKNLNQFVLVDPVEQKISLYDNAVFISSQERVQQIINDDFVNYAGIEVTDIEGPDIIVSSSEGELTPEEITVANRSAGFLANIISTSADFQERVLSNVAFDSERFYDDIFVGANVEFNSFYSTLSGTLGYDGFAGVDSSNGLFTARGSVFTLIIPYIRTNLFSTFESNPLYVVDNRDPSYWTQLPADDDWEWPSRKQYFVQFPKRQFLANFGFEDVFARTLFPSTPDASTPYDQNYSLITTVAQTPPSGTVWAPKVRYQQWGPKSRTSFAFPLFYHHASVSRELDNVDVRQQLWQQNIELTIGEVWEVPYRMTSQEYTDFNFQQGVRFGPDQFILSEIDGFDASGQNDAKLLLLRRNT